MDRFEAMRLFTRVVERRQGGHALTEPRQSQAAQAVRDGRFDACADGLEFASDLQAKFGGLALSTTSLAVVYAVLVPG